MVKRKAGISLDEWLDRGVNSLPISSANISATTDFRVPNQHSTAEGLHLEGKGPLATGGLAGTSSEAVQLMNVIPVKVAPAPVQRVVEGSLEVAGSGTRTVTDTVEGRLQPANGEPTGVARKRPQPVSEATGDVARDKEDISEWFWRLLEQSGYELCCHAWPVTGRETTGSTGCPE